MASDISIGSLIIPAIFTPYVSQQSVLKNALIRSGIIFNNPMMSGKLAGAGKGATLLSFQNLDTSATEANATNADQSDDSTPEQIHAQSEIFARLGRNKSWSAADWDASLLGVDPMAYIGNMVANAVMKWRTHSLVAMLNGQAAAAEAAVSGSLYDSASETLETPYLAGTQINATTIGNALIGAWGDMGTRDQLMNGVSDVAVFMNSATYAFLQRTDYTAFQRISIQTFGFTTYLGFPVYVDDEFTSRVGTTSGHVYATYFIKAGAISFGYAAPKNATELWRNPDGGNGGGVDKLYQRDDFAFHVNGWSYTGTLANDNVTDTQLATAANWTQVLLPKQTGVVTLLHNLDV